MLRPRTGRIGITETEMRRMLNPRCDTKAATLDYALHRLGKRASIHIAGPASHTYSGEHVP
jgi:hypothetical protein